MSVLIKGIGMPKNCEECPCYYETEGIWRDECQVLRKEYDASEHKVRPDWCPLIEVPTPHGRLGDLDALVAEFHRLALGEYSLFERFFADGIFAVIDCTPTVIEAEE